MQIKASANRIRVAPRKARLIANLVRGLKTDEAINQLNYNIKKSSPPILKLIKSALANASNNYGLDKKNFFIKEIRVDEGPTIKRWMPRAHGRATPIRKKMSNIRIVLQEIKDSGKVDARKQKVEKPIKLGKAPAKSKEKKEKSGDVVDKKSHSSETNSEAINDPRGEGRGGHTKIEGKGTKGFASKIFRRKSG